MMEMLVHVHIHSISSPNAEEIAASEVSPNILLSEGTQNTCLDAVPPRGYKEVFLPSRCMTLQWNSLNSNVVLPDFTQQ